MKVAVMWFRRDLRLAENCALEQALKLGLPIIPIFIFDENILNELPADDPRVNFIYEQLQVMNHQLQRFDSSLHIYKGDPKEVWQNVIREYDVSHVFTNKDYEPYAIRRDREIEEELAAKGILFKTFKDQVIFEEDEIMKDDGTPYTVFTPYKRKWLFHYEKQVNEAPKPINFNHLYPSEHTFPSKSELDIMSSDIKVRPFDLSVVKEYKQRRDFPTHPTSDLSPHLRFGTVSIRQLFREISPKHETFRSELIWREFFMQILYHFPKSVGRNFKSQYDDIRWRNDEQEFEKWCKGETGYPLVDAGMRQLNETGYMHNRVRMVVASFLCKHLLIDWRWGEVYFAQKLLDFELSSNVGNWQWAAGTGCDAAPYFRIFNPTEQLKKFDPKMVYVRKWVKDIDELTYPQPMVDHKMARERCLNEYKRALDK